MSIFSNDFPKSWGQIFVESKAYLDLVKGDRRRGNVRVEVKRQTKALTSVGSVLGIPAQGAMPAVDFQFANPTPLPRRTLTIRDLLSPGKTNSGQVAYLRQTARTNGAATVAEGGLKPASAVTYSIAQARVSTIAHTLKESRELFDDSQAMQAAIDNDLMFGARIVEENQMLYGDGTNANLLGMVPQATAFAAPFTPTGETNIDVIGLAILQAEQALVAADGIVLNPLDYTKMLLLKDGQGRYILGNPGDPGEATIFKLPVATSTAMTAGTFLVGAFRTVQIFDREEVNVSVASENEDDFVNGLIALRAEERLAMAVKRPEALIAGTFPN